MRFKVSMTDAATRSLVMGIVGGLHSQFPLAILSRELRRNNTLAAMQPGWSWLYNDRVGGFMTLSMVGEIFVDKLPIVPPRIERGPLLGRVTSGMLTGAAIASVTGHRGGAMALCGALGGAGAVVGAYTGYYTRMRAGEATNLPDPALALVEDACAFAVGTVAAKL